MTRRRTSQPERRAASSAEPPATGRSPAGGHTLVEALVAAALLLATTAIAMPLATEAVRRLRDEAASVGHDGERYALDRLAIDLRRSRTVSRRSPGWSGSPLAILLRDGTVSWSLVDGHLVRTASRPGDTARTEIATGVRDLRWRTVGPSGRLVVVEVVFASRLATGLRRGAAQRTTTLPTIRRRRLAVSPRNRGGYAW